jgi:hypothetical protein
LAKFASSPDFVSHCRVNVFLRWLNQLKKKLRASTIIAAVIATVLYVVDSFVLSLPFFALVLFAVVMLYFLPATLWALRSNRRIARLRAAKAGIYLLAAISIFVTLGLQNSMADRRAVKLGDACLAYRTKYHHYPKNLEALVPEFIPSVPVARYGLLGGDRFNYSSQEDDREPMLYYEAMPPFGRRFYHMESRSWGYLD